MSLEGGTYGGFPIKFLVQVVSITRKNAEENKTLTWYNSITMKINSLLIKNII